MIYLFTGDDWAIEQQVGVLSQQRQISRLYQQQTCCSGLQPDQILDLLAQGCTPTLMGEVQMIWLKRLGDARTLPRLDQVLELLEILIETSTCILVISSSTLDGRVGLIKWLKAHAVYQSFEQIPPWDQEALYRQAQQRAKAKGICLSQHCTTALVEQVGNDSRALSNGLDLLDLHGSPYSSELVRELVPPAQGLGLEFVRALLQRDVARAGSLLERSLSLGEPPLALIALCLSQIRLWLGVKAALTQYPGTDNSTLARIIGLSGNPNRVYHLGRELAEVSLEGLIQLLGLVLATEKALKSGSSEKLAMQQLVLAVGRAR